MTLGVNICSVRVPSLLVWWRHNHSYSYAVLQWIRSDSVFTPNLSKSDWIETSTTSGYGIVPDTTSSADWIEASTTSGYRAVPDTTSSY